LPKTAILISDVHAPLHDEKAVQVLFKSIPIIKPDIAVIMGDFAEMNSINAFQWARRKRPPLEYIIEALEPELEQVNAMLDKFDEVFKKNGVKEKHFLVGNHEDRLERFVEEHPYLADRYTTPIAFRLKERGYRVYKCGEHMKLKGCKLNLYHGQHVGTELHTKAHLTKYSEDVAYAHRHGVQRFAMGGFNGLRRAYSLGCLKSIKHEDNEWLHGRPHSWEHAFGILHMFMDKDKNYRLEIVDMNDGETVLYGKHIKIGGK